jgi:hypothetical protein
MRSLAYIQTIKSLAPIAKADAIEKAEVLGWEIVVKKGDFNVGDKIVYCEIDSILPEYPCFEFLRAKRFRIRTIKLRGQISQGIVFPLSVLTDIDPSFKVSKLKVGDDVTEALKIVKYDPEAALDVEEEQVKKSWLERKVSYYKWKLFGFKPIKKGNFPSDVPKTDETRVQMMGSSLEKRAGEKAYITEKVEGTSATFVYRKSGNWLAKLFGQNGMFQVCSRNRIVFNSQTQRSGPDNNHLMKVAEKYNIRDGLTKLNRNIAIQGECIGPKIQGNIYKIPDFELRVFLIYDIDAQIYLPYYEMMSVCAELKLGFVPILEFDVIKNDIKYYVELSKGKSNINPDIHREGIVIRSMTDNFSFKSINPEYLLKQE